MTGTFDITGDSSLKQNEDFLLTTFWKDGTSGLPIDVSGYTARMQVRYATRALPILLEFLDPTSAPSPDLVLERGSVIIGGADGQIQIFMPGIKTANIRPFQGVYDLVITSPGGAVRRHLEGAFHIDDGVTR
jgi:hypothetical protein